MNIALLAAVALALLLGFVVFFGPPWLPTKDRHIGLALDLLELKPGQTLLDLGSGDGRVLVAAARRGVRAVGIELSPILALISWLRTRRYRKQVRIIWGSYFVVEWPPADALFTFMIPRQMTRLDRRIEQWHTKPLRLASFAFEISGKVPEAVQKGVFVYRYK